MPFDFSDELCSNGQIAGHHSASGQECIDREEDVAGQGGEDQGTAGGGGEGNGRLGKNIYKWITSEPFRLYITLWYTSCYVPRGGEGGSRPNNF